MRKSMGWIRLVKDTNIFWQYPVCTEKKFCEQNNNDENFIGFPWATVIDKKANLDSVHDLLIQNIDTEKEYFTCCQHIFFKRLTELFKSLNIKTLYTPHKQIGENYLEDIKLLPCPLYAVNIEDNSRNFEFKDKDLLNIDRDVFYSFAGGYQPGYLTDIRLKIFELPKRDDCFIYNTGYWHFNEIVYSEYQNKTGDLNESEERKSNTRSYNELLLRSRYTLCPSGSGPNSIRFWESLGAGSIPILLADTLELPENDIWDKSILRISEEKIFDINDILSKISKQEEYDRRLNCLKAHKFFRENYNNKCQKK